MTTKSFLPSLWQRDDDNFHPFRDLHREVDRLFSDFGRGIRPFETGDGNGSLRLIPEVDIAETEDAIEVTAELAGVDEKDIDVTLKDNMLTIKAEKKTEKEDKNKDHYLVERSYGMFQRSIPMPVEVKADKVDAKIEKGILKITLPKAPEAQASARKIEIKSAA